MLLTDPQGYYFQYLYRYKIYRTPPMECDKNGRFEVHILTCRNDLVDTLWCIKTFLYFSKSSPNVVVHDDGSLTSSDFTLLRNHLVNVKIVSRSEGDKLAREGLSKFHFCSKYRFEHFYFHAIKLFDPILFAGSNPVLILDSDILFFGAPKILMDHILHGQSCYLSDYRNSYSFSPSEIFARFGIIAYRSISILASCSSQIVPSLTGHFWKIIWLLRMRRVTLYYIGLNRPRLLCLLESIGIDSAPWALNMGFPVHSLMIPGSVTIS